MKEFILRHNKAINIVIDCVLVILFVLGCTFLVINEMRSDLYSIYKWVKRVSYICIAIVSIRAFMRNKAISSIKQEFTRSIMFSLIFTIVICYLNRTLHSLGWLINEHEYFDLGYILSPYRVLMTLYYKKIYLLFFAIVFIMHLVYDGSIINGAIKLLKKILYKLKREFDKLKLVKELYKNVSETVDKFERSDN